MTLFLPERHVPEVDHSFQILSKMMNDQNEQSKNICSTLREEEKLNLYIDGQVLNDERDESEEEQIRKLQLNGTMYGSSKFYHAFNGIIQERSKAAELSPTVGAKVKKNAFYNVKFLPIFAKNYLSIVPLWTGLLITDPKTLFYHNQHAESNFNISKTSFRRNPVLLGKL